MELEGRMLVLIIVIGINKGLNSGLSVYYSGTLGAAREANFCGIPAIGVSMENLGAKVLYFEHAAKYVLEFLVVYAEELKDNVDVFKKIVFNLNIPNRPDGGIKGWKYTKQGPGMLQDYHIEKNRILDGNGDVHTAEYKLNYTYEVNSESTDDCCGAVAGGYCSVNAMPLYYDEVPSEEYSSWRLFV